jgi:hypothetical protein
MEIIYVLSRVQHYTKQYVFRGQGHFADKDFFGVKPVGRRQAYGLAATVQEKFGGLGHV